ncbi:MAG: cytochrome c3 family protein [Candidatus Saccharibacteria bacterium]
MKYRLIFSISIFFFIASHLKGQSYQDPQHHACLKCHSNQSITFHNDVTGKEMRRLMNPYYVMDTIALRGGVHKNLDCTDCHSSEYQTYPHQANLKLEPLNSCLDCHGGDESFAKYKFEQIQEEFQKSVHFKKHGDYFTCTKCHNIHTYVPTARNSSNVLEIVDYSNKMCLSCHNDMRKYSMVAGRPNPVLVKVHEWLPNQELHFKNVRCIECHTRVVDSLMVSHNIMPKDSATRNCVECHSANSKLKASLYKYENLQKRAASSTIGTVLSNSSYIIGTHQSPFLKILSIILFLATLSGIIIHSIFRIIKKK